MSTDAYTLAIWVPAVISAGAAVFAVYQAWRAHQAYRRIERRRRSR